MVHLTEECSDMKEKKSVLVTTNKNNAVREGKGAGSRRIFSPVFKLQVLDSYRQDADCQGNQRATARKYGIHRRQIQKWLQMETNLRVSVQQSSNLTTALNLSPARQCDDKEENMSTPARNINYCNLKEESSNSDSEEYVNVDEITDSEEDETSSCSSYERNDGKALDFTCATLSKRRFYTSDFKLLVIDAFKKDTTCKGNQRATARKFAIHRRQVQKWLNQEAMIRSEQALSNTCLDLSAAHKRKLHEPPQLAPPIKKKPTCRDRVQEAALCLVKTKVEDEPYLHHPFMYPSPPLEHSFSSSSPLNYISHEYPVCGAYHQPWTCCYHPISSTVRTVCSPTTDPLVLSKYSYSFDVKYDNSSYVDIPVQYGFGDSIPSKWIKENPLYLHHQPASIQVLSSYR